MVKQKQFFLLGSWLLIFLTAAGCATVGHDFPATAVENIVIDKTTNVDLLKMLGEPWRTGLENGRKTWTYGYYVSRVFGPTDTKDLYITFNADNTVAAYNFNKTQ